MYKYNMYKRTTETILKDIEHDLDKMKQDTSMIKMDLKYIINELKRKEKEKEEINEGWTIFKPFRM